VTAIGDVNRAKLYYLRGKVGKRARVRAKRGVALPVVEPVVEAPAPTEADMPPEDTEPEGLDEVAAEAEEPEAEQPEAEQSEAAAEPEPEPEAEPVAE